MKLKRFIQVFFSILLISIQTCGFSQMSRLDSIKLKVRNSEGIEKLKALNSLAFKYAFNDFDSALHYINISLALAANNGDDSLFTEGSNIKGIIFDIQGITDSSEYYFLKTYNMSKKKNFLTYERFSINNLGMMYWRRGDLNKALDFFFEGLKLATQLNNERFKSIVLNNIGLIYQDMKQFNKALIYQKQTLKIRKDLSMLDALPDSYNNIGICYKNLNKPDSAIYFFNKSIEYSKRTSNAVAESLALSNLGDLYFTKGDYKRAEEYNLIALSVNQTDAKQNMNNNMSLSGIYYGLGQYDKGIEYGLKAKKWVEDNKAFASGYNVYKLLSLNYAATGQKDLALENMSRWQVFNDSIFSEQNAEAINRLEIAFKTEQKEKEILKQKVENEKLQKEKAFAEIKIYNRNKWIIGIIASSLILIFFLLFLSQKNKRKVQAEKDTAIILEREKGLKEVFIAQEDERKRIAKDLHDGIGQQLSAVKMYFQSITNKIIKNNPEIKDDILKIDKMITETGDDVRNISHQMMPKALMELGLIEALKDLLENCFIKTNVVYNFEHFGFNERLPSNIEIVLYRITQELLQNIMKHSGASKVDVQLTKLKNYCVLVIEDNGKGILQNSHSDGIGMLNINNRLRTINGNLNLDSGKGRGTTATIRIALT